jgi:hypothetical protein
MCGLLVFVAPSTAMAGTVVVNPDGSGDYLTIQSAVEWAPDGSEILIAGGEYSESIYVPDYKVLSLAKLDNDTIVMLRPGTVSRVLDVGTLCSVSLDGLVLDGSDDYPAAGIIHTGRYLSLESCEVRGFSSGIRLTSHVDETYSTSATIRGTIFHDNDEGIQLWATDTPATVLVSGCTFTFGGDQGIAIEAA